MKKEKKPLQETQNDREIKFRVWDKFNKYMIDWDDSEMKNAYLHDLERPDYEWMRYTGLKDTKGVEICEGDVVKYYYNTYRGSDEIIGDIIFYYVQHWIDCGSWIINFTSIRDGESLEILGNKFDNPELLKNKINPQQSN